jgi:tetratricopeptide (TPR) repeat protein
MADTRKCSGSRARAAKASESGECSKPKAVPDPSGDPLLVDRYFQLAEKMNAQGAVELAVPFYRQALTLLLEERRQLRQLLPESARQNLEEKRQDELRGLLNAAELLTPDVDLEASIAELAQELTVQSAQQVLVGLQELLLRCPGPSVPAEAHSLRGKALLLQGNLEEALSSFLAAQEAEPGQPRHGINLAGALLMQSRYEEALPVLRLIHQGDLNRLSGDEIQALLRNLASAESQAGNLCAALCLRHQWLLVNPDALSVERWLDLCRPALDLKSDEVLSLEALSFLRDLHRLLPGHRAVMEVLAQALEGQGDYREAALLYRELLRS